ncbi:MAG: phenylpyruvate tautomerase MIF-related protein [Prochloraceae cyanobacterium]
MPLIKVQSSVSAPEKDKIKTLLSELSASLAKHLGKPESYVMTGFEADIPMSFAGNFDPVAYVEVKSIGTMKPEQTKAMSQDFCDRINQKLGIPTNRIYIEFADADRHMWGWNNSTFA